MSCNKFLFRCQYRSKRKYSLKEGNLTLARLDERTDDERECSSERGRQDTTELSNEMACEPEEENSKEDEPSQREEEADEAGNCFQGPINICKQLSVFRNAYSIFQSSLSQCQSLTQYPLRGSQSM